MPQVVRNSPRSRSRPQQTAHRAPQVVYSRNAAKEKRHRRRRRERPKQASQERRRKRLSMMSVLLFSRPHRSPPAHGVLSSQRHGNVMAEESASVHRSARPSPDEEDDTCRKARLARAM